jgi:hypothetical protein
MISGTNQWGAYTANDNSAEFPNYAVPEGTATPSPTGSLNPPESPSGAITTNTGRNETATETYLSEFGESEAQQGATVANATNTFSGGGGVNPLAVQVFRWE